MIETGTLVTVEELVEDLSTEERLMQLDAFLINMPQVEFPLTHKFTPNLYIREVYVPANVLFTTYVHKTEHPFFGGMGELLIWEKEKGWQHMVCPCTGITEANTKRIVYTLTDVVFTTIHANPTDTQDEKELHDMLFENYENEFVDLKQLQLINR